MKRKLWMTTALLLMIPALLLSVSCAKKTVAVETNSATGAQSDSSSEQVVGAAVTVTDTDNDGMGSMPMQEDIYFEFDKAALTAAAKESLIRKADWLEKHSTAGVIIEGHCDERGTPEYNLALGERRAQSTKLFLADLGVSPARLTIVSYGEEQPADPGQTEEAWTRNRRAHFAVN